MSAPPAPLAGAPAPGGGRVHLAPLPAARTVPPSPAFRGGLTESHSELRRLVHNSESEELETALKRAIHHSPFVASLLRQLATQIFPELSMNEAVMNHLTSDQSGLPVGELLRNPDPEQALRLDAEVLGVGAGNERLLEYAIVHRDIESVQKLLDFYPAIQTRPGSPFWASVCVTNVAHNPELFQEAVKWGNPRVFEMLLNAQQGFIITYNGDQRIWCRSVSVQRDGLEDLLFQIAERPVEMEAFVKALITAKADVGGAEGKEDLPIHVAARNGHTDIVRYILGTGGNVNAVNHIGQTPLHLAFRFGRKATADVLLESGANPRAADKLGRTPLHYAFDEVVTLQANIDWLDANFEEEVAADAGTFLDRRARAAARAVDMTDMSDEHREEAIEALVELLGAPLVEEEPQSEARAASAPHWASETGFAIDDDGAAAAAAGGAGVGAGAGATAVDITSPSPPAEAGTYLVGESKGGGGAEGAGAGAGGYARVPKIIHPEVYLPEELHELRTRFDTGAHVRNWLMPKEDWLRGNVSDLAIPIRRKLVKAKQALELVVDMAVRMQADLTARDNSGKLCFTHSAMLQWYKDMEASLATEAWTNVGTGYTSQLFEDPRTMLAVQRRWELDIQGKVYGRLCRWFLFIILVMVVAVMRTGRDSLYTRAFVSSFEEAILFDEYGDHHSGFFDMRNEAELWQWTDEILAPNVYDNAGVFRDGDLDAKPQPFAAGSIYFFNKLIGRPRFRQLRTERLKCGGVETELSAFGNSACFQEYDDGDEDTRKFRTGNYTWEWSPSDSPSYEGVIGSYDGSGFSAVMPEAQADWDAMIAAMKSGHWVDMHTRFVIIEMALFNPGHDLFLVCRMAVEFTASGGVIPTASLLPVKLMNYHSSRDTVVLVLEIIVCIVMLFYVYLELTKMAQPWPKVQDPKDPSKFLKTPTYRVTCKMFQCKKQSRGVKPAVRTVPKKPKPEEASPGESRRGLAGLAHVGTAYDLANAGLSKGFGAAKGGMKALGNTVCALQACGYKFQFAAVDIDTHIRYRPYFFNSFNFLNIGMIVTFITIVVLHIIGEVQALNLDWSAINTFINVHELAIIVRAKQYLWAVTVFIVWIKTLEFLRVNRSLSTFILIIKGMMARLVSFFTVLLFCLISFAGLQYVAFGLQSDGGSTMALSVMRGFTGALGDIDLDANSMSSKWLAPAFGLAFAVFILILLFNLLIAVMSEAYEEIKDRADAAWCFTQFQMIDAEKKAREEAERRMRLANPLNLNLRKGGCCKCCCPT